MSKYLVAYATILALRKNIDETRYQTQENYVNEFHQALRKIEKEVGSEVFCASDFSVDAQYIAPKLLMNSRTKGAKYSRENYCETKLFLTKIDAALNYLQMIASKEDKQKMGF